MNEDSTTGAEGLDEVLGQLPRANPDAARAQRVRARCHGNLSRSRLRASGHGGQALFMRSAEAAVVGGFCAAYVSLLTLIALRTHGVL